MKKIQSLVSAVLIAAFCLSAAGAFAASSGDGEKVNINTASASQLSMLPGVGPSKADAIVKYRTNRPFKKIEHIMRVKGIGRKSFNAMRDYLAVDGPTTVKKKIKSSK